MNVYLWIKTTKPRCDKMNSWDLRIGPSMDLGNWGIGILPCQGIKTGMESGEIPFFGGQSRYNVPFGFLGCDDDSYSSTYTIYILHSN